EIYSGPVSFIIAGYFRDSADRRFADSSSKGAAPMPVRMGNAVLAASRRPTSLLRACVSTCAVFASSFGAVRAADLTNPQPAPASDAPDRLTGWYVRLGAMG